MELIEVDELRPIEGHSKKRVRWLHEKIAEDNLWTRPICVEKNHLLVLDGMHRFEVAKLFGFKFVPCELFDYSDIELWSLRKNHLVNRQMVIEKALAGDIYPYKTVKHKFPEIDDCNVALENLK